MHYLSFKHVFPILKASNRFLESRLLHTEKNECQIFFYLVCPFSSRCEGSFRKFLLTARFLFVFVTKNILIQMQAKCSKFEKLWVFGQKPLGGNKHSFPLLNEVSLETWPPFFGGRVSREAHIVRAEWEVSLFTMWKLRSLFRRRETIHSIKKSYTFI